MLYLIFSRYRDGRYKDDRHRQCFTHFPVGIELIGIKMEGIENALPNF